ncbi:MAG: bifunctional precorrin-2 dehydrogenase/sirohydrochlorin ferrochelatase, partial [Pseudomonadota bacterium]
MSLLPLFIDIKDKPCLLVGGGRVAARKLKMLCHAEAKITVIAPKLCEDVQQLCDQYTLDVLLRKFEDSDIGHQRLIIAASNDAALNNHISQIAKQNEILVNVSNDFTQGDVVLPSIINRDPIQIAVTTGGASPVLARLLRSNLERSTPAAYGTLASLVEKYRSAAK